MFHTFATAEWKFSIFLIEWTDDISFCIIECKLYSTSLWSRSGLISTQLSTVCLLACRGWDSGYKYNQDHPTRHRSPKSCCGFEKTVSWTFWNREHFASCGSVLWNGFPTYIRNIELSLNCFRRELTTFYLYRAYQIYTRSGALATVFGCNITFPTWNEQNWCDGDLSRTVTSSVTTSIHKTELSVNCFRRELKTFYLCRAHISLGLRDQAHSWRPLAARERERQISEPYWTVHVSCRNTLAKQLSETQ